MVALFQSVAVTVLLHLHLKSKLVSLIPLLCCTLPCGRSELTLQYLCCEAKLSSFHFLALVFSCLNWKLESFPLFF
ncbi:hypothetical protein VNO77_32646 [Canavalia gladiata]|uniref:Uncharacterized protein n=1 Tax=Canavalia gladiata TaxID=3824 RepID=A0AAN9KUK4_CANGL